MQSGTKENSQREVEMKETKGTVLKALISYMYGCLKSVPANLALQLFVAADAHQASFQVSIQLSEVCSCGIEVFACLQVELLRWTCLQQIISQIHTSTVLEYAAIADAVADETLMDACVDFMVETESRQEFDYVRSLGI